MTSCQIVSRYIHPIYMRRQRHVLKASVWRKVEENGLAPTKILLPARRMAGKGRRISYIVKYDDDRGEAVDKRELRRTRESRLAIMRTTRVVIGDISPSSLQLMMHSSDDSGHNTGASICHPVP